MHKFHTEAVTVTDQAVALHGCWDFGVTKRFEVIRLPVELFIAGTVLEALNEVHQGRKRLESAAQHEWEQFVLFG